MSLASGEEDPNRMDQLPPDPLLQPGTFIDPNPTSNGDSKPEPIPDPTGEQMPPADQKPESESPASTRPDWLPPGWSFVERVRVSGASAGTRDKYYLDPVTNRRFRSKKEVLFYLENGTPIGSKKKNATAVPDADSKPQTNSSASKRRKSETKMMSSVKKFNFDEVPTKVKWELTDVYEGTWRPMINGVDRVPESTKQDWATVFSYLTTQNGATALF